MNASHPNLGCLGRALEDETQDLCAEIVVLNVCLYGFCHDIIMQYICCMVAYTNDINIKCIHLNIEKKGKKDGQESKRYSLGEFDIHEAWQIGVDPFTKPLPPKYIYILIYKTT